MADTRFDHYLSAIDLSTTDRAAITSGNAASLFGVAPDRAAV
jgi:hypothetical protein